MGEKENYFKILKPHPRGNKTWGEEKKREKE